VHEGCRHQIASRSATPCEALDGASADFANSCTSARPFSDFILIAMLRLLRLALETRCELRRRKGRPSPSFIALPHRFDLDDLRAEITQILRAQRTSENFERSRTLTPSRGFATTVSFTRASSNPIRGKQAAEIGGNTFFCNEQIIGRTTLSLVELGTPAPAARLPLQRVGRATALSPVFGSSSNQ